jgi:hypothetical protein
MEWSIHFSVARLGTQQDSRRIGRYSRPFLFFFFKHQSGGEKKIRRTRMLPDDANSAALSPAHH